MENKNQTMLQRGITLLTVIIGNAMYAAVAVLFLLPSGLPTGGTTGIALLVNRLTGLSVSMFVLGFNIVMLVVGFIFLGKKFAFTTIVSTFTYPICLELFGQIFANVHFTDDIWLNTIFSGLGIGVGLGIVIRMGASTGGMDIPPLILNKYFKIPVSVSLNAFDICILLGQAILIPPEMLLYGVILVITYTTVLNKVLLLGGSKMEVKIISRNPEPIRQAIIGHLDRGLTILRAEGGYSQEDRQVLLVVVSNRELHQLERIVKNIDPESFVIVSEVREVSGRGFSLTKEPLIKTTTNKLKRAQNLEKILKEEKENV